MNSITVSCLISGSYNLGSNLSCKDSVLNVEEKKITQLYMENISEKNKEERRRVERLLSNLCSQKINFYSLVVSHRKYTLETIKEERERIELLSSTLYPERIDRKDIAGKITIEQRCVGLLLSKRAQAIESNAGQKEKKKLSRQLAYHRGKIAGLNSLEESIRHLSVLKRSSADPRHNLTFDDEPCVMS
ncbi:MAG: hypothetical protein V4489_02635 [Chlamydiota bacterium]